MIFRRDPRESVYAVRFGEGFRRFAHSFFFAATVGEYCTYRRCWSMSTHQKALCTLDFSRRNLYFRVLTEEHRKGVDCITWWATYRGTSPKHTAYILFRCSLRKLKLALVPTLIVENSKITVYPKNIHARAQTHTLRLFWGECNMCCGSYGLFPSFWCVCGA